MDVAIRIEAEEREIPPPEGLIGATSTDSKGPALEVCRRLNVGRGHHLVEEAVGKTDQRHEVGPVQTGLDQPGGAGVSEVQLAGDQRVGEPTMYSGYLDGETGLFEEAGLDGGPERAVPTAQPTGRGADDLVTA